MKESEAFPIIKKLPKPIRYGIYGFLTATGISGAGVGAALAARTAISEFGNSDDDSENLPKVERQQEEQDQFTLPLKNLRNSDPNYYTGGPHSDGLSRGIRSAIDLAGKDIIPCPENPPSLNWVAVAAAQGKVTLVGQENDRSDRNHSIVEIDHGEGLVTGYMHLANIRVRQGQNVEADTILGNLSCEVPPGGRTTGQHLHFYLEKNGRHYPIDGFELSGWVFKELPGNYQGTAEKNGEPPRTVDQRRCGPDEASIRRCGGIRNDLSSTSTTETPEQITYYQTPEESIEAFFGRQNILFDETCLPGDLCAYWYNSRGNLRVYSVLDIPATERFTFLENARSLILENSQRGWRVLSAHPHDQYPPPFLLLVEKSYTGWRPPTIPEPRTVIFRMYSSEILFDGTVIIRTCIKNNTQTPIPWVKDLPGSTYIKDNKGKKYFSFEVGGRFTKDYPEGLPSGKGWCGWHRFPKPVNFRTITLYFPGQKPTGIFLP